MKAYRLFAGILLLAAGLLFFLALESEAALPITAALWLAGIALIASSRRRKLRQT